MKIWCFFRYSHSTWLWYGRNLSGDAHISHEIRINTYVCARRITNMQQTTQTHTHYTRMYGVCIYKETRIYRLWFLSTPYINTPYSLAISFDRSTDRPKEIRSVHNGYECVRLSLMTKCDKRNERKTNTRIHEFV